MCDKKGGCCRCKCMLHNCVCLSGRSDVVVMVECWSGAMGVRGQCQLWQHHSPGGRLLQCPVSYVRIKLNCHDCDKCICWRLGQCNKQIHTEAHMHF